MLARIEKACACKGENCFQLVDSDILLQLSNVCVDLTLRERYLLVAGKLDAFARCGDVSQNDLSGTQAEAMFNVASARVPDRSRITFKYAIDGVEVCKAVFAYMHKVSEHTPKATWTRLKQGAVMSPTHGSAGRLPWNAFTASEVSEVKTYQAVCSTSACSI